jgi:OmcA/MtrC family decaheme c-type cytochrome
LLTNDLGFGLRGLPASTLSFAIAQLTPGVDGGSSEWQSYVTNSRTNPPNVQASTEASTAGTLTDNLDGTYTYTFAQNLTDYPAGPVFDELKTHRLGVEIRTDRALPYAIPANNAPYDFVPAGGSPAFTRLIVNNAACNACHDNLELHGEARFDVEYCVTCHNPYSIDPDTAAEAWGGTVDMKAMIHKIHAGVNLTYGYAVIGYGGSLHDYSDIHFPQDLRNCTTCHQESDPTVPQAGNWKEVQNRAACGTCHDSIDWDGSENDPNLLHAGGFTFLDDTDCVTCHGADTTAYSGAYRVAVVHQIPEALASEMFEYQVLSVTNTAPGDTPTVQIRVLNPTDPDYAADPASTAWDIQDPNGPFQTGGATIRVNVGWNTDNLGNVDPNDDLARSPTSGAPFQPLQVDFKSGATNVGNNVFEKTANAGNVIPTGVGGSGVAYLEGHPQVDLGNGPVSIGVTSSGLSFAIDDPTAADRRPIADIAKCNDCHQTLALHGDNRVGNTELCATCHNPNATDVNRRAGQCAADLGADDESIDLKVMVHRIHDGNVGLCGYQNSTHDYTDVVYPGKLNNCEGCHLSGTFYPVDPNAVMAVTVDAGNDRSSLLDDTAVSPNAAVCTGCHVHQDDLARNHMTQNGADFAASKMEDGSLSSASTETCQLCHGPGASADTAVMHGVGEFQYN